MIHDEICTFEVCKLAKEKGFDWGGLYHYDSKGALHQHHAYDAMNSGVGVDDLLMYDGHLYTSECLAPTQSLLQRWLREEKGIIIDVILDWSYNIDFEEIRYQYRIGSIDRMTIEGGNKTKGLVFDKRFTTYELALEDALAYSLKNLV